MRASSAQSNDRQPGISSRSPELWLHGHVVRSEYDLKKSKMRVRGRCQRGKMSLLTLIDRGLAPTTPRGTSYKFKI